MNPFASSWPFLLLPLSVVKGALHEPDAEEGVQWALLGRDGVAAAQGGPRELNASDDLQRFMGVPGQYHQSVSAMAQTRSPKSEGRKKTETRNPKFPSLASAFGIRPSVGFGPSEFGFGRLAAGGTVQIRLNLWWR